MKKRIKLFKILCIITFCIIGVLLALAIPLHISEIIAMQECAAQEGCMYCVPARTILAFIVYFICFILLNIAIIFLILYKTIKK